MKKQLNLSFRSVALASALFVSLMSPLAYSADVFGPPSTVDYQGSVLDGNGNPLAPTTAANYEMQFRLYDAQTGGTLVWAEKQLVTVKDGKFSVRLGEGSPILAALGGLAEGTVDHDAVGLPGAFEGKERFLGVTVVIPGQTPGEIQPRLAFLSSPFSFVAGRAQSADRLVQSASDAPSSLNVSGISYVPALVTASSTLGKTSSSVLADATAGAVTTTLPGNPDKREITVTKNDPSANPVTVVPPGGGLINGSATPISLAKRGDSVTLRNTDGNNWIIISRYSGDAVLPDTPISGGLLARGGVPGVSGVNRNGYAFSGGGGDNDSGLFSVGDNRVGLFTNNTEQFYINGGSVVSNGAFTAQSGLSASGNITATGNITANNNISSFSLNVSNAINSASVTTGFVLANMGGTGNGHAFVNDSDSGMFEAQDGYPELKSNGTVMLKCSPGGYVAVGLNASPTGQASLRVNGIGNSLSIGSYGYLSSGGTGTGGGTSSNYGIWSDGRILCGEFNATSDERIKNIIGVSDSMADLTHMMQLKVTDYSFRDTVAEGPRKQKKLIAQEVEKAFPLAVSKITNVVPDIMKKAVPANGWIKVASDLKKGERVRVLSDGKTNEVYEVLEVKPDGFRISFQPTDEDKEVFVYGREVKDFRTVDYDAIAMLNVSASQQIKKDSDSAEEALRKENEILKDKLAKQEERLAALEKENTTRETRLAALEAALLSKPKNATVSAPAKPTSNQ